MACTWRIRHKLMLGMGLVVAIMALLLGGTLYGLASYRAAMGTCESKLEELKFADQVKEEIRKLRIPSPERAHQARYIQDQIPDIEKALKEYALKLQETIDRKRDEGKQEQAYVKLLTLDLEKLHEELRKEALNPRVNEDGEPFDLLGGSSKIREKLTDAEIHISDLIGTITKVLSTRIERARTDARKSIMLLSITGILAVLLMAGNLRFFYRWVAQPIRDLELGVSRVARGDFQYRIEIHSGDEIEDLAKSYNEMTDKLRAMYDNLAQQVNERSRQLVRS